jgi:hypothetical protein
MFGILFELLNVLYKSPNISPIAKEIPEAFPIHVSKRFSSDNSLHIHSSIWRKEKEEIFYIHGGSHTRVCSPLIENTLRLPPSCDPPSGEPTLRHEDLPYNQTQSHLYQNALCICKDVPKSPIDVSVFKSHIFPF